MMIQEIKQGMKVRNAGGDVFEIKGTKGDLVLVELLKHNSSFILVNHIHETFTPGKILEIDQISETVTFAGYCEVALEYLEPVEEAEEAEEAEEIEESDVPIFLAGDLVKDKFGNTFKVVDADKFEDFSDDCMHYNVELVIKQPNSPIRKAGGAAEFEEVGYYYWIYDTAEDAASRGVIVNDRQLLATELVLVQSVLQTKSTKTGETGKSKIQKPVKPAKPAKPTKAEIAKRYPSIEDLQKMSEENDLGKLLDQAYKILKDQASLGERNANLQFETFKRCIPHFEREGFEITEHGMLIEVQW